MPPYISPILAVSKAEYLGVPTVIVEDDAGDPRIVSDAQMKATLAEYFKMLAAQRST